MCVLCAMLLCTFSYGGVYVDVCMCVGVFKCSVMMGIICYEQFHINKPLLTTKTSVLYNKRIASKHKTKKYVR